MKLTRLGVDSSGPGRPPRMEEAVWEFGGLGEPDLERMGIALRSRWSWLQRTCSDEPWQGLNIPSSQKECTFVAAYTICTVGNGASILFWEDNWLGGSALRFSAGTHQAQENGRRWIRDITGVLGGECFTRIPLSLVHSLATDSLLEVESYWNVLL